jgi:dihydrofolate reductase
MLTVNLSMTLDGVVQAPGRPGEDTRGGFAYGGWASPYFDPMMGPSGSAPAPDILLGRRTYEDFYSVWPKRKGNPFTDILNNTTKYVASRTLTEPLAWQNSTLLAGDAATSVARLKAASKTDLVVLGSVALVQSLLVADLVDEYVLSIHPLALGTGARLFRDGGPHASFDLVDAKSTRTGVVIARYRPTRG